MYLDSQNSFLWTGDTFTKTNMVGGDVFGDVIDLNNGVDDLEYAGNIRTLRGKYLARTIFAIYNGVVPSGGTLTGFELELVTASSAALSADVTILATSTNFASLLAGTTKGRLAGLDGFVLSPNISYERYLGLRVVAAYAADSIDFTAAPLMAGIAMDRDGYVIPTAGNQAV